MDSTVRLDENLLRKIIEESLRRVLIENSEDNGYVIKNFTPDIPEWNNYIKPNKKELFKFLDNGYKYSGLENGFLGCLDEKSLVRNANLIRIAFYNDIWVAMSVYTGYLGGYKCVGITATCDKELRKIGVNAVHEIVKTDVGLYDEFYWTECSGALEYLYDKYGGIKIPVEFVGEFIKAKGEIKPIDDYHYERFIYDDMYQKIIFGFNNQNTFNAVYKKYKDYIDKSIKDIENKSVNEENNKYDAYKYVDVPERIITVFIDLSVEDGLYEFPEDSLNKLEENIAKLEWQINKNLFSDEELKRKEWVLEQGKYILVTSSPMTLNVF